MMTVTPSSPPRRPVPQHDAWLYAGKRLLHPHARAGAALILLIGLCLPAAANPARPEELGVLFYSPVERGAIERARSGGDPAAEEAAPTSLQFNGLVRRGQGKSTAWVNNRPWPEGQARAGRLAPVVSASGVAVNGTPLRVGESVDLTTGQRSDFISPGALRIKQPK